MDQTTLSPDKPTNVASLRRARPRSEPNRLREWLQRKPRPMTKQRFADLIGCTAAYVSMLLADNAPWPGREIARRIAIVTEGEVTPNDLAGYPPDDD
ncbi:helix-turn-helix transcriptional regulator [Mesorhizobium sp. M0293]|uniref:helix-turn-helix domain-containing protein n=1 Tax=Mesorhizobium sp. M0293 TaxID=2956930 RepID=UPI00333778AE